MPCASRRRRRPRPATPPAAALAACVAASFALLAPVASAADGTDRLLQAYPLEQQPAQRAPVPVTHRDAVAAAGATRPAQPDGPPWPAILLGSGAAAVLALVAAHRVGVASPRRRRPAAASPSPSAALGLVPAAAPPSPAPAEVEHESPPPPARPVPEPPPDPVAAAPRNVCQIRWHRDDDGSWFEAVVVGGRDRHTLASSPRFDWRGTVPPDRSPGAQAALRALVADLDETGWSPLRGRGREAGAPRWYARRFCRPVAADAVATAGGDSQSRRTGVR